MNTRRHHGFTMVELVVTLIIVGVMAVVAAPRLIAVNSYNTAGFADRVLGGMRFAQKQAIAKRRNVCLTFTATTITLTYASAAGAAAPCNTNLPGPNGQNPYVIAPDSRGVGAVVFSPVPAAFSFNALGRPTAAQTVTISGDEIRTFRVEPETGYVHT